VSVLVRGGGDADWSLAPGVHAVAVDQDLVLLDVAADAYFCLVGAGAVVTLGLGGAVRVSDPATLNTLLEAGLVVAGRKSDPTHPPPRPVASVSNGPAPRRPTGGTVRRIIHAGLATSLDFRRLSFERMLAWAGRRPQGDTWRLASPSPALLAIAEEFARFRVWAPFDGACLKRSYMMLRYLRLRGHDAAWVIGVRTWPFMAHCWLQVGEVVLDDHERLLPYHPILAV
jgi:hypothetical protein